MITLKPFKYKQLPKEWEWLLQYDGPKTIVEALQHYGILEIKGKGSNPDITKWAKELNVEGQYTNDEIPWCGLFVGIVIKRTGRIPVSMPLWARNWVHFGVQAKVPSLGDILVFKRGAGGHVGFYIGETEDAYAVLGGNQSNSVTITWILKNRLIDARHPKWLTIEPSERKKIILSKTGELSNNEA